MANPNWKDGVSGNPHGRPRKPEIEFVREAIEEVKQEKKKSLWKHLIEQCYEDNTVLIAVAKKFMPDQVKLEVDGDGGRFIVLRPGETVQMVESENGSHGA